jgi:hypothetical protein
MTEALIARFAQLFLFWQCRPRFAARKACPISHIAGPNSKIYRFGFDQDARLPGFGVNPSQPNASRGRWIRWRSKSVECRLTDSGGSRPRPSETRHSGRGSQRMSMCKTDSAFGHHFYKIPKAEFERLCRKFCTRAKRRGRTSEIYAARA